MRIDRKTQDFLRRIEGLLPAERANLKSRIRHGRNIVVTGAKRGPLSHSQHRQWFLDQIDPGNPTYNSPIAVRIKGSFDCAAFENALDRVVAAHEILRTRFGHDAGGPVQVVESEGRVGLQYVDLIGSNDTELEAALREATNQPFDLTAQPLLRAFIFHLAPNEHALLIVAHHIVCDGWSLGLFVRALCSVYHGGRLAQQTVQYLDFALWERDREDSRDTSDELRWWVEHLAGAQMGKFLPLDHQRRTVESHVGEVLHLVLPNDLVRMLETAAAANNTTLFVLLLSGVSVLLSRWSDASQFLLGTPVADRPRKELEGLIGLFINTAVLRIDLSDSACLSDVIKRMRRVVEVTLDHQRTPFEKIVRELCPDRNSVHDQLFQVMVTYFNEPTRVHLDFPGVSWEPIEFDRGFAYRDLTFRMGEIKGCFKVDLEFRSEVFERSTIEALGRDLPRVLTALIEEPERSLSEISVDVTTGRSKCMSSPVWAKVGREILDQSLACTSERTDIEDEGIQRAGSMGGGWPIVLKPKSDDFELAEWLRKNRERVDTMILQNGAILLRGFGISSAEEFSALVDALGMTVVNDYAEASTPRTLVKEGVFTSTEYSPDQTIKLHNECAYLNRWPARIFFFCQEPAKIGGATTLADSAEVFRRIDRSVRNEFQRRGVLYVRNFHEGVDLPWQEVFQSNDRQHVEVLAGKNDTEVHWWGDGVLRTQRRLPAVIPHPRTLDPVWFNSAHMFHVASHTATMRDSLRALFGERLPRHALFGDGGEIPDSIIEHICDVYRVHSRPLQWCAGDVLLLDNLLTAHGREAFEGSRRVLVMMAEPQTTAVPGGRY